MILQKLAATGDAARNRRTVIFLSPSWFLQPSVDDKAVGANLSLAQLSAWVFGSGLSRTLKTDITRRLRDFSADLKEQTLIASAVQCLATPSPLNRLRFALCYPLGKLQNALLERLDYCVLLWENVFPQRRWAEPRGYDEHPPLAPGGGIDWPRVLAEADAARRAAGTAPDHAQPAPHPAPGERDAEFVAHLQTSREFDDLALLARALRKLRVDALFISQPFDGSYSDSTGVSAAARRGYYERLAAVLREHGYKFCDSSEHEEDRGFFGEVDHPSARAWLFYDQQIDAFYHRRAGASPTAGSPPGGLVGSK
jgi:poly-D-alanine transfer protein DltD